MSNFFNKSKMNNNRNDKQSSEDNGLWDDEEAHFSGHPPPTPALDQANRRTSQVLPLLVKPTAVAKDSKKKAQPVALPKLVQRPLDGRHLNRPPGEAAKEQATLPKASGRQKLKKGTAVPVSREPDTPMPLYPELADEQFSFLWEKKRERGKPLKSTLETMDEKEVLNTILASIRQPLQHPSAVDQKTAGLENCTLFHNQMRLYKYYGLKLRNSQRRDVIMDHLRMLLRLSLKPEANREGIGEAFGVAAFCHLGDIVAALRDFSGLLDSWKSIASQASEEEREKTERQMRATLMLCYGQAASGAKAEDLLQMVELMVAEVLSQFRAQNKDEELKRMFMRAIGMISGAIMHTRKEEVEFPLKSETVVCITGIIKEEPLGSVAINNLHQALVTISSMTCLKPPLELEVSSELVSTAIQKVFSLPFFRVARGKAGRPTFQAQEYCHRTINACQHMLSNLLLESPSLDSLQEILRLTKDWINSPKTHEQERALRSTSYLLRSISEQENFDFTPDFSLLGQLVAVLALHITDGVKEVSEAAAETLYHLHHVARTKTAMEMQEKGKNKKGKVVRFQEVFTFPGPLQFYNNIPAVAKAFGEHLSSAQSTAVALQAIVHLTNKKETLAQAAGVLLSSFLEECGKDMDDLPTIIREIYNQLSKIKDPFTKEETIRAVCSLAARRMSGLVDALLNCSVECDETAAEIWKALTADRYCSDKLIKPLLKRLRDEDVDPGSTSGRHSRSLMPIAATSALCHILSMPEAAHALNNKFPHLLVALLTQIYHVSGTSWEEDESSGAAEHPHPAPLSTAVQALQNLLACAGFTRECSFLGTCGCWDRLCKAEAFFKGLSVLVRTLFAFKKAHLKMTFRLANAYLCHSDVTEKTVGTAIFTELLFHQDIGFFFEKRDILKVLRELMGQRSLLLRIFSVRGLRLLLQFPTEKELLEPVLCSLISCALDPERAIAKEAVRTIPCVFRHLEVEEFGFMAIDLIPHLLRYFSDDEDDVRQDSVSLFGMLLTGVKEHRRHSVTEDVLRSLVPLLIQLADPGSREAAQGALYNCASFMRWPDISSDFFDAKSSSNLYDTYLTICKHTLWRHQSKLSGMLAQMADYLRSNMPSYRQAAALLIACNAPNMTPDVVTSKQLEAILVVLQELQGDSDPTVASAAHHALQQIIQKAGCPVNPRLVQSSLASMRRSSSIQSPFEARR